MAGDARAKRVSIRKAALPLLLSATRHYGCCEGPAWLRKWPDCSLPFILELRFEAS